MFVRGVLVAVLTAGVWMGAGTAFAHDPIVITDQQTTPEAGPLLPDGTISFALYGVIDTPAATRGLRVQLAAGDTVNLSLLVPARDPEQSLADADMPTLTMVRPDGSTETFTPTERVRFDESFSGTSYVRLLEVGEPAQAGEYDLTVTAAVPARFTVAVGTNERFGTPVENVVDRANASKGIADWYATPPPVAAAPTTTSAPETTVPETTSPPETTVPETTVPPTTLAPQTGGVDGAAGSAVFIGAIAIVLAGVGFLVWSKRRNATSRT
jgi:hypothetical protein